MAHYIEKNTPLKPWPDWKLFLFRPGFIFVLLLTIPLDRSYYTNLFSFQFHFQDLFQLTYYAPSILHLSDWGLKSYAGWLLALIIAIVGAFIWQAADRKRNNYDELYYWSRAVLRYRLALGIISFGILLLFPAQLPPPALSDLHTAYGDFLPWKIYYHSTAVASAGYRQTIAVIEIIGGLLLLYRRSVAIGAIIVAFLLVNIVLANFAYDLGTHLYSSYLLLLALVLLAHDIPRLYSLLVKETKTVADRVRITLGHKARILRRVVRIGFATFILLFIALTFNSFISDRWPYPNRPGLRDAEGYYDVSSFTINGTTLPWSLTDSVRWKDVVFEKWNVLSIRRNHISRLNLASPALIYQTDAIRNYESVGNGGRDFYTYNENGNTIRLIDNNDSADVYDFTVTRPDASTILLQGKSSYGDSLSVTLNRIDKKYLLRKGRRKPVSVY